MGVGGGSMRHLAWLMAMACVGSSNQATDRSTSDDRETSSGDTAAPSVPELQLVVTDPDGSALAGARAQILLAASERVASTDETGLASFATVDGGSDWWGVDIQPPANRPELLAVSFGINAPTTAHRTVELTLPRGTPTSLPTTDAWVSLGDGVEVLANRTSFEPGLFEPTIEDLAAASVLPSLPTDGLDGTVLAMWAMHPPTATSDPAVPLRLDDDCGSIDCTGATLELWQVAPLDASQAHAWERRGALEVADGWLQGPSLHHLGPIALVLVDAP